ncbi:MAG: NYN domain-containing protein, partial [Candidatus Cloacimonetes bacterium]|nr:NYN domain-containing protein [Candidatus Cloacimonadota bacterium]
RVEALAFNNISQDLINEADGFTSGYMVPELSPIELHKAANGKRFVRGVCYSFFPEKGYGFMRYMKNISGSLWIRDTRKEESPYGTAFVHGSQFTDVIDTKKLPNRNMIFEFELKEIKEKGLQAENVKLLD